MACGASRVTLAQTPGPFGMQPGTMGQWAPGLPGIAQRSPMGSFPGVGPPAAFQLPGQGAFMGPYGQAHGPMQPSSVPFPPGLGAGAGVTPGTATGLGAGQGYAGVRPPPMMPKNQGKSGGKKGSKGKEGSAAVDEQVHVGPRDKAFLTLPTMLDVPQGIPKGLEILAMIDGLSISQEVEPLEALANAFGIGYEGNNSYKIMSGGLQIYRAVEDTNFLWRCFCNQLRPAHMRIYDQSENQVLAFKRNFRWFPCAWIEPCRENVIVYLGNKDDGVIIGRVTQSCCGGCCEPKLNVLNTRGERELIVRGPCVVTDYCGAKFDVLTNKKKKIGQVQKRGPRNFADIVQEITTDADNFQVLFPEDLKVETKASLVAAILIVDFLFFENGGSSNRNLDGSCTVDLCVIFCCGWPIPCRVVLSGIGQTGDKGTGGAPEAADMER